MPLVGISFQKYCGTKKFPEQFFRLLQEEIGKREEGRGKILLCLSFKKYFGTEKFPEQLFRLYLSCQIFQQIFFEGLWFVFGWHLVLKVLRNKKISRTIIPTLSVLPNFSAQLFRLYLSCQIFQQIFFEALWFAFG